MATRSAATPAEVLQRTFARIPGARTAERLLPIRRGREEVWLSLSEAVMRDPVGEVAGRIFASATSRPTALVEQMKSGFVSTVSHELRAPLTSIYGFAETLLRHDVSSATRSAHVPPATSRPSPSGSPPIVDTLLNVARLEAGDLQRRDRADRPARARRGRGGDADPRMLDGHEFVARPSG